MPVLLGGRAVALGVAGREVLRSAACPARPGAGGRGSRSARAAVTLASTAWTPASATSPTHDAPARARSPASSRSTATSALFFAEHTHIPASRETPVRRRRRAAAQVRAHLRPVRRADAPRPPRPRACGSAAASAWSSSATRSSPPRRSRASTTSPAGGSSSASAPAGTARRWRNHGTDPRTRMALLRERVEAMKAIWTQDEASYHGALRRLRPDLVVAEARPAAAPAGAGRRQRADRARPRAGVRRRLVPELRARQRARAHPGAARARGSPPVAA